ncbi:MAG: hypothetical protein MHMPM18_002746 [Marteilia pararefringens]
MTSISDNDDNEIIYKRILTGKDENKDPDDQVHFEEFHDFVNSAQFIMRCFENCR